MYEMLACGCVTDADMHAAVLGVLLRGGVASALSSQEMCQARHASAAGACHTCIT